MANVLIIHDDSVFSRVAYLLEQRKENICRCRAILNGEDHSPEYRHVNMDGVRSQLAAEQWALQDLLEDIDNGMLLRELKEIFEQYAEEKVASDYSDLASTKLSEKETDTNEEGNDEAYTF